MKKIIAFIFAGIVSVTANAAGGSVSLDHYPGDVSDTESLQRGAKYFYNYCFACHSVQYARYNRVANDLGISEDIFKEFLIDDASASFGQLMTNSMDKDDAKKWFGATPPDLTLVARVRGTDWLYSYLRAFYKDDSRPWGVNNAVFKDVGMPHVQMELQGLCAFKPVMEPDAYIDPSSGESDQGCAEYAIEGELTPQEFDRATEDLVNFLDYMGEPIQLERQRLGYWVIGFLLIFLVFAYLLNREYWKDLH